MKLRVVLQGVIACVVIWTAVVLAQRFFGQFRITAERFEALVEEAAFKDWSMLRDTPEGAEAEQRREALEEISQMYNRLDFVEMTAVEEKDIIEAFVWKLSGDEMNYLWKLTAAERKREFEAIDKLSSKDRKKFFKRRLRLLDDDGKESDFMDDYRDLYLQVLATHLEHGRSFEEFLDSAPHNIKRTLFIQFSGTSRTIQGLEGQPWEMDSD